MGWLNKYNNTAQQGKTIGNLGPLDSDNIEEQRNFINNWNKNRKINNKKVNTNIELELSDEVYIDNDEVSRLNTPTTTTYGYYDTTADRLMLADNYKDKPGIPVHELSHKFQTDLKKNNAQKYKDLIVEPINKINNNKQKNDYLNNSDEIHSELNRYRYYLKFKPEQIIKKEDLKDTADYNLDFNNDELVYLLNNTADNSTVERLQKGGSVPNSTDLKNYILNNNSDNETSGRSRLGQKLISRILYDVQTNETKEGSLPPGYYTRVEYKDGSKDYIAKQNLLDLQRQDNYRNFVRPKNTIPKQTDNLAYMQQGGNINQFNKLSKLAIKDNEGQYNHPRKITEINSGRITMKNVKQPLLAITDNGIQTVLHPEQEYNLKGAKKTIEIPISQNDNNFPVQKNYKSRGEYNAALKTYNLNQHKYNLENNADQLKNETDADYEQRMKYFDFKIVVFTKFKRFELGF